MSIEFLVLLGLGVAGVVLIAIGVLHIWLPKFLGWEAELSDLTPMTRMVISVHSGFIGLTCFGFGVLALFFGRALVEGTPLALAICGFAAVFFVVRWILELGPIGKLATGGWRLLHWLGVPGWLAVAATFGAAGVFGMIS